MREYTTPIRYRALELKWGLCLAAAMTALFGCSEADPPAWMSESVPQPTMFAPGVISTSAREYGITFTPDGLEAYFTRREGRRSSQIYVAHFVDGRWSSSEIAPFSVERDAAPWISLDGTQMLFSSRRPARGSWDRSENIWVVDRTAEGWATPTPVGGEVNRPRSEEGDFSAGTESGPMFLSDGSLLYWARTDPDWGSDLYLAHRNGDGSFGSPKPLTLNSYGDESSPAMSPDEHHLFFQGYRDADAPGEQDLYVSTREEFGWSEPRPLPHPVNSPGNDGYPSFSPDGRYFFFASDREGGVYNVYYVEYEALGLGG